MKVETPLVFSRHMTPGMERNMKLKPTVNRKIEVGLIGKTPAIRLDMTAFFFEKQTDGFSSSAQYIPFSYREYDYLSTAQLRPEYKDGQVWVNGKAVPYQEKYSYTPVSVPVNTLHRKKHGIEMVADLGTFSPLRTSLIVDGIWLYVREKNTALNGIWPIQYTDKTEYPYVGFYDRQGGPGNESRSEIISTNFRFITRIPRIGLVTTLTWQMIWLYKYRTLYNGSTGENVWPLYWCGTDGIIHPFTEAQKEDPAFAPLLSTTAPERFLPNSYKPYGMLNIRVNKAFGEHITLAFFANNLADLRPTRYSASTRSYLQQNTQPFFGLELQINYDIMKTSILYIFLLSVLYACDSHSLLPPKQQLDQQIAQLNDYSLLSGPLNDQLCEEIETHAQEIGNDSHFAGNPPNHIHSLLQITGHGSCENATRPHETLRHPHKRQAPSHESPAYGISSRTDTPNPQNASDG